MPTSPYIQTAAPQQQRSEDEKHNPRSLLPQGGLRNVVAMFSYLTEKLLAPTGAAHVFSFAHVRVLVHPLPSAAALVTQQPPQHALGPHVSVHDLSLEASQGCPRARSLACAPRLCAPAGGGDAGAGLPAPRRSRLLLQSRRVHEVVPEVSSRSSDPNSMKLATLQPPSLPSPDLFSAPVTPAAPLTRAASATTPQGGPATRHGRPHRGGPAVSQARNHRAALHRPAGATATHESRRLGHVKSDPSCMCLWPLRRPACHTRCRGRCAQVSQMEAEGLIPVPTFINGVEAHTVVRRRGGKGYWVGPEVGTCMEVMCADVGVRQGWGAASAAGRPGQVWRASTTFALTCALHLLQVRDLLTSSHEQVRAEGEGRQQA
jgi:hypothetical protein